MRGFYAGFLALLTLLGCGAGPKPPPPSTRILWKTTVAPGIYYGSPALSADESTVYVGTSLPFGRPPADQFLVALDAASGRVLWRHALGKDQVRSTPAIAADGSIFVTLELSGPVPGDHLLHLSAAGEPLWSRDINTSHVMLAVGQSAPALGPDGTVYVGGDQLHAFMPDGTRLWSAMSPTGVAMRNAAAIAGDGTVYFAAYGRPLAAIDPATGSPRWTVPLGDNDYTLGSPAIAADGTVYVPTDPGILYAVSPAGQLRWSFSIASAGFTGYLRSSPAIDADGNLYFGMTNGSPSPAFFSLRPDGTRRWIFVPGDLPAGVPLDHFDIYSSPAIGSDGSVYFGQEFGRVSALDLATGKQRWLVETATGITWPSPALARSGRLYIADLDGNVYGILTDSSGLQAGSPWPEFRHDGRHTGAVSP